MTLEDLYDMIREQQKLLEKILKLLEDRNEEVSDNDDFDIDVLEKFFDEFDYWGTLGWLQAIMNGGIDLDVLRECVRKHSEDTLGSYLPDNLFIKKDIEEVSDGNE